MKFSFRAKTKTGELREGVVDASSRDAAVTVLQKNELFPISVVQEGRNKSLANAFMKSFERVTPKELMVFFRQLAILIEARVPIVSSLVAINGQTENKYFQRVIEQVVNDIQDGLPFSDALAKYKDVFSPLSISVIRAGEVSGNLRQAVEYVADNIEKNYKLTSNVRSAMLYPAVVLVVFSIIAFIVVSFIVPKLTQMIKELNAAVPWYTKIVVAVGDFMAAYWWAVAIVILGFIAGFFYYIKSEDGKKEWDQIKIKLPIFGVIFRYVYISRFVNNLAVLLTGGIPILKALSTVSSVVNNCVYEALILQAADEVKKGGTMSAVLQRSPAYFPPIVGQMIKIGEESGQVDKVLKLISDFYENEVNTMTKNLASLIEPVLMITIGIAVAILAFAVILPIYNIAAQY